MQVIVMATFTANHRVGVAMVILIVKGTLHPLVLTARRVLPALLGAEVKKFVRMQICICKARYEILSYQILNHKTKLVIYIVFHGCFSLEERVLVRFETIFMKYRQSSSQQRQVFLVICPRIKLNKSQSSLGTFVLTMLMLLI